MSLILSRMQNFRAASRLDQWEERASRYGALDLFARQTDSPTGIITEDLQRQAQLAQGNTLETMVYDKDATVTIGSSRPTTVSDDENTTAMQSISFTTYQFGFTMIPAQYSNNETDYQRDFNYKLTKHVNKLMATLDTACDTVLNTNKTQVFSNQLGYTVASNILTATDTERLRIFADLNPMFMANDFNEPRHIVGNAGVQSIILEIAEQGLYNQQNRAIQWADKEFHFTTRIADAADKQATGYAVMDDCLGMVFRHSRDAMMRHTTGNGYQFSVQQVPGIPVPMDVMYYDLVADKNTLTSPQTADLTATKVEGYSFAVDIAFVTNYNSDLSSYSQPIIKFNIDTDDTL